MSVHVMDWYWRNSDQDGNRLLVLLALSDWANDEGECYPGTTSLGKKARIARTTLKNILSEFEKSGKIGIAPNAGVEYNGGHTNRYYLNEFRQHRLVSGLPAPLPAIITNTLASRSTKKVSLKDKLTLVTRMTPGQSVDIPPGHTDDPKPLLEPSVKPSDSTPATQVTVITSKFPYRDTVASSLTIGTARALDIVHILQGTSKKYAACNCTPPVSEDEFKACMVWRNGKFIPQKAETVQNMIAEWRVSVAYRNWQNRQSAPIQADDESSADEQSLSYQEQVKQNLLYGAMATGGNNGNAG